MCNHIINMQYEAPTQKYGFLDIKQSSKVKGRKMKSWRRRWVVLTKMSDLSSEQIVGRLDVYDNEAKWREGAADRTTFVLEHVTSVAMAKSRTHAHAFEIAERQPVLVLSGSSEIESYGWILALQQIFQPDALQNRKDTFEVDVLSGEHSVKWHLTGQHTLIVNASCVSLLDTETKTCVSWGLSTLIKFNVEKHPSTGVKTVLVIQCGPNSPTGSSSFQFNSPEAMDILAMIRQSICMALANKQNNRRPSSRHRSISATISERSFQNLLDSSPIHPDMSRERSGSESSTSTINTPVTTSIYGMGDCVSTSGMPGSLVGGANSPMSPPRLSDVGRSNSSGRSSSELGAVEELEERDMVDEVDGPTSPSDVFSSKEINRQRSSSEPDNNPACKDDPGYSIIKDNPQRGRVTISRQSSTTSRGSGVPTKESNGASDKLKKFLGVGRKTVSFDSEDDNNNTKTQDHYQELNGSLEPGFGRLNRRRSSSTGDINAFLKQRSHENTFENVYEELDEMRNAVAQLGSRHVVPDIPPALPARPFSASFTTHSRPDSSYENKQKRSFFKNMSGNRLRSVTASVDQLEHVGRFCTCDEVRKQRLRTVSTDGNCIACGGYIPPDRKTKKSSNDTLLASNSSSSSDVYSSISDVIISAKQRRISDITPVSQNAFSSDQHPGGFHSLPRRSSKDSHERLIDLSSDSSDLLKKPQTSEDPLISFFLDDQGFKSNPMVTGALIPVTSTTTPNIDLLTINDDCTPSMMEQTLCKCLSTTQPNGIVPQLSISPISPPTETTMSPFNFLNNITTVASTTLPFSSSAMFAFSSTMAPPLQATVCPPQPLSDSRTPSPNVTPSTLSTSPSQTACQSMVQTPSTNPFGSMPVLPQNLSHQDLFSQNFANVTTLSSNASNGQNDVYFSMAPKPAAGPWTSFGSTDALFAPFTSPVQDDVYVSPTSTVMHS